MVAKRTFVCYGKNSTSTTKTGTTIITWKFNRSEKTYVS